MTPAAVDFTRRRGQYGIDATYVPRWMGVAAVAALVIFFTGSVLSIPTLAVPALNIGLALALSVADYLYASRVGKFAVWRELLLSLRRRATSACSTSAIR